MAVLNRLLYAMNTTLIQGHSILLSYLELEDNVPGLAAVVEKVMELENPDAYFAVFFIQKNRTILLIARSRKTRIDLHELLHVYGGGGHQLAASAKISDRDGRPFYDELYTYLENSLSPATRARDIMTRDLKTINENISLLEASMILEEADLGGAPVVNDAGDVSGYIGLRDIMKGRKQARMQAPVKGFMSRNIVSSDGSVTMREVERIFYKYHVGHLLIIGEKKLLGIVSRWDFLQYKKRRGPPEAVSGTLDT